MRLSCAAIFLLFFFSFLWAEGAGRDGASFLDIPVGGRPAALGGAYSSLASDVYAPVINPAGLGFLQNPQLGAMHLSSIESINYEFASLAHPIGRGQALGASAQYVRPGAEKRLDENGIENGEFDGSFAAYSVAYGLALGSRFSLGIAPKFVQERIAGVEATAFGGDVGALYHPWHPVSIAAVASNIGTRLKFENEEDPLPLTYRLGLGVSPLHNLLLAVQGSKAATGLAGFQAGMEWTLVKLIALRVGYRSETSKNLSNSGISAGVGLNLAGQLFDYAWVPYGDFGDSQYFSMVFQWGHKSSSSMASAKEEPEDEYSSIRNGNENRQRRNDNKLLFKDTSPAPGLHP